MKKIQYKSGNTLFEIQNTTAESFSAREIQKVIQKKQPAIYFNDCDARYFIFDFCFSKKKKQYWMESKYIAGDFSKIELNIYE